MIKSTRGWTAFGLAAVLAVGYIAAQDKQPARRNEDRAVTAAPRQADDAAIRRQSREFDKAFSRGDAKAVASFWTEQGEYHNELGEVVRGRDAIEKEFAQFFQEHPKSQTTAEIVSIRFPSRDLAIEEGVLLRQQPHGKDLPASTLYRVVHTREDGKWKIAYCREWGAGQDRLHDLTWLLGDWKGKTKDQESHLSFTRDSQSPSIIGRYTKKSKGTPVASGTMRISLDPQTGQLRSWHFDEGGGHGQSLWIRDGNRWVLDAVGVQRDGTDTAAVNVLSRMNNDEFTFRSIDRVIGGEAMPDTTPVKLTRVPPAK